MRTIFLLGFSSLLSSCAALYTGEDLDRISPKSIKQLKKAVTFRFINVDKYPNYTNENKLSLSRVSSEDNRYFEYLKEINPFQEMKVVEFPYARVSIESNQKMKRLLRNTAPKVRTDYFVDIHITRPQYPHGSGMGMYGGLISFLTLGIIPAWWTSDQDIKAFIFENDKKVSEIEIKEDYNIFLSSLFNLVPGSEYTGIAQTDLTRVDKNALRNVLIKIQDKIKD